MRRSRHTSMLAMLGAVGLGAGLALCIAVLVGGTDSDTSPDDQTVVDSRQTPHDPSLMRQANKYAHSSTTDDRAPAVLSPDVPLAAHVDSRRAPSCEQENKQLPQLMQLHTVSDPKKNTKVGWYSMSPPTAIGPADEIEVIPPVRETKTVAQIPTRNKTPTRESVQSLFDEVLDELDSSADSETTSGSEQVAFDEPVPEPAITEPQALPARNPYDLPQMESVVASVSTDENESRNETSPLDPPAAMSIVDSPKQSSANGSVIKKATTGSTARIVSNVRSLEEIARGAGEQSEVRFNLPTSGTIAATKPTGGSFTAISTPSASISTPTVVTTNPRYGQQVEDPTNSPAVDGGNQDNGTPESPPSDLQLKEPLPPIRPAVEGQNANGNAAQSGTNSIRFGGDNNGNSNNSPETGTTISIRPTGDSQGGSGAVSAADQGDAGNTSADRSNIVNQKNGLLSIRFVNEDIRKVLETLGDYAGLNILAGSSVQGQVSVVLNGVTVEQALDAILKSAGFSMRREGKFIYVGSQKDFDKIEQMGDRIGTRIYRPNYVSASEFESLITPLLTPDLGTVSVTSQPETGIASDDDNAGGNGYAGADVLMVRDYEAVLMQIDQMVEQIDVRPMQVAIEAMVLQVKLTNEDKFGVNFQFLRNKGTIKFGIGDPAATLANFKFEKGALKFGFLDSSLGAFIEAVETVGDTDIIATPRVIALNKHRAEIQIGEQKGYLATQTTTDTSTVSSVQFLETGTILRLRPFISDDGIIRLEVHPELSTGDVKSVADVPLPNKTVTQVTTNIMIRDGCTIVIGGLIREQLEQSVEQVPVLGNLPWLGPAFRSKTENTERYEVIVVLTPRIIYEPGTSREGNEIAGEFLRRHSVFAEKMSPLGRRSVARRYSRLAQNAWAAGDRSNALRFAEMAVQFDPLSREAIELRSNIWLSNPQGEHTLHAGNIDGVPVDPLTGIPSTISPEFRLPNSGVIPTSGTEYESIGVPTPAPAVPPQGTFGTSSEMNQAITGSTVGSDTIQQSPSVMTGETEIPYWMLQRAASGSVPVHPYDRGRTGVHTNINKPGKLQ